MATMRPPRRTGSTFPDFHSLPRASPAELAMTKPARPLALSDDQTGDPQIVGVVGARHADRKTRVALDAFLVHARDVEGGLAMTKSNLPALWCGSS